MTKSLLADAVGHHVWATLTLIDACRTLSNDQLDTSVPGTYGSILDTMRHLLAADAGYLALMSGDRVPRILEDEEAEMSLDQLRERMERHGIVWSELLATDPDPDEVVTRHRDDGSRTDAPFGIRLAQAIHHGTDHRSQICTALTTLGIEPPEIDVWSFGFSLGRVVETPPTR